MLDNETRRRIDTGRDILVGKVPDPKSQVEQITIALIYKFMDDMDAEAEELGGSRTFFAGDFARYGWGKLMRSGLGGNEILNLYAEAISRMTENTGVPALFRDIFKNAYLPYRDPETLKSFLKVIDDFRYDHSERLGDAFEYLLSVLGSQGDAGQFRTPRHIIDFMVQIIDPRKGETLLDPACGTAGFLISAYKHVLAANARDGRPGAALTPEERARLVDSVRGYDISPDMVRLSLVNMYLHGFADPHIVEYDTLTSEERWGEHYDVIFANPPFMSPKGGIKPHKRFSIGSSRSEVLFVDYIAEHLTPNGRAGIIVPEGVIFQSGSAYKALRKLLVESALVAVVSLPAGVFNPYSGVKTSILILDRGLAKRADTVGFFKVENDGFGLGAQRRPIDKNDLPLALGEVRDYLARLRAGEPVADCRPASGLIVEKARIAANGEYNLSGERYREGALRKSNFPLRRFEDVCTLEYGAGLPKEKRIDGPYPVVGSNGITGYHNEYLVEGPVIIVGRKGSAGEVTLIEQNCFPIDTTYYVKQTSLAESNVYYLYWVLKSLNLPNLRGGAGIPGLNRTEVYETYQIPLPPLDVQREIVAEIEGYRKVIDGARQVVENYRPRIAVDPAWPIATLKGIATNITDGTHVTPNYTESGVPFLRVTDITGSNTSKKFISEDEHRELIKRCHPVKGDILYSKNGTIGVARLVDWDWEFSIFVSLALIKPNKELVDPAYLTHYLNSGSGYEQAIARSKSGTVTNLHLVDIKTICIPLPPLVTQQAIVAEIEAEGALVAANRDLIVRFERKIAAALRRVWGEG